MRSKNTFSSKILSKTLKKAYIPYEHDEQVRFVEWWTIQRPKELLFAIPNGEWRSKKGAVRLLKEGVKPGIPDMFVPCRLLWIEMKRTKDGRVNDNQKKMHEHLRSLGHTVIVTRGCDEAIEAVEAMKLIDRKAINME